MYTGPNIVTDGLVLCLDAANTKSYPGSGTTWRDLSGRTNNFTLNNSPTFSNTVLGSFSFDGANDYGTISTIPEVSNCTYTLWLKWNSIAANQGIFGNENILNGTNSVGIRRRSNNNYWLSQGVGQATIVSSSLSADFVSNWHSLSGTTDGSFGRIYINGVLTSQASYNGTNSNTGRYTIGAVDYDGVGGQIYEYFNGNIASIMVYNRALSASEVLQNYNATKTRFGL